MESMEEQVSKRRRESVVNGGGDRDDDDDRVREWEAGLPTPLDLTPLSQALISPELASAFSITAEPHRSIVEVNRASHTTLSNIRRQNSGFSSNNLKSFMEDRVCEDDEGEEVEVEVGGEEDLGGSSRKIQRVESLEEADSTSMMMVDKEKNNEEEDDRSGKTLKRARLVWTPQLHKRFVDVVAHLEIKNAVPKTIMQLMNVEGLTRENVASHLQKYRLYLKRMQGLTNEGPSATDHLFASTPIPRTLSENRGAGGYLPPPPMPYGPPFMGHMGAHAPGVAYHHGFEFNPYHNMYMEHQGDWSANKFGMIVPHSHATPTNK